MRVLAQMDKAVHLIRILQLAGQRPSAGAGSAPRVARECARLVLRPLPPERRRVGRAVGGCHDRRRRHQPAQRHARGEREASSTLHAQYRTLGPPLTLSVPTHDGADTDTASCATPCVCSPPDLHQPLCLSTSPHRPPHTSPDLDLHQPLPERRTPCLVCNALCVLPQSAPGTCVTPPAG